jgi:SAM-dependent methyltransferase
VAARQHVIPNGIDETTFQFRAPRAPEPGAPWRVLFVGQLAAFKGVDVLLRALALLPRTLSTRLELAYHVDTEKASLRNEAERLGLADVHFLGARSPAELAEDYARAHVFVLPSYGESLPSVISEAMFVGRPVIATDVGGVREQVGDFGQVIAPGDPQALAATLRRIIDDYERYVAHAPAAAQRAVDRYSVSAMVSAHEEMYRTLTQSTPTRRPLDAALDGALRAVRRLPRPPTAPKLQSPAQTSHRRRPHYIDGGRRQESVKARRFPSRKPTREESAMNDAPAVTRDRWRAASDLERDYWATQSWQDGPGERRLSEWERHLSSVGLSLSAFTDQHVLDVGCGPTGVVYFIEAERRVGIDPLADQYEQWNGYWGRPIELITSNAEAMPLADESFDTVFCVNCLDHTRNPAAVISEIARVLKPGGTLVLHVDLDSPLRKLHKRVRPHAGVMHPHSLTHDWLHAHLVEPFDIKTMQRDPHVFQATRAQMRYEAFWDGLFYRLTRGSHIWINHVWLRAERCL